MPPVLALGFGCFRTMLSQWQIKVYVKALMASNAPHNGERKFSDWIAEHGSSFVKISK